MEFELPGDQAMIHREGNKLIIEPVTASTDLLALLASWEPLDGGVPDVDETSRTA